MEGWRQLLWSDYTCEDVGGRVDFGWRDSMKQGKCWCCAKKDEESAQKDETGTGCCDFMNKFWWEM